MTTDARLLEKLAKQMLYLDRLIADAHRRKDDTAAQFLEEQRMQVQLQRSTVMRHDDP